MSDHIDHPTQKGLFVLKVIIYLIVFILLWASLYYHEHNHLINFNN